METKTFKLSGKPAGTRIAAGIDVHKYKLQVFILGRFLGKDRPLGEQVFVNDARGREEMCRYVAKYCPGEIIMEKTGVLSDPVLASIHGFTGWKDGCPGLPSSRRTRSSVSRASRTPTREVLAALP
jgi:hypothetical protein